MIVSLNISSLQVSIFDLKVEIAVTLVVVGGGRLRSLPSINPNAIFVNLDGILEGT